MASVLLFLIVVVLVAKLFESDLASIAMDELGSEIGAPVSVGKVSAIPLFSFPRFSAEINDLWMGEPGSKKSDSVFYLRSVKVGLDTWDLINGKYTIDKLEISGLNFDYYINTKGKSNIDFLIDAFADTTKAATEMPPDTSRTTAALFLTAQKGRLADISIRYFDTTTNTAATVYIPQVDFRVKTENDEFEVDAEGSLLVNNCCFEDTRLDLMDSGALDFKINYNDGKLRIERLVISSEGIRLGLRGEAGIGNAITTDIQIDADEIDFDILKKYIPEDLVQYIPDLKSGDVAPVYLGVKMKYQDEDVVLDALNLKTEGLDLGLDGTFKLGDTISVDADFEANKIDYGKIKKFIPEKLLNEYGIVDFGGEMALSVMISGQYADSTLMPGIVADVSLKNLKVVTRDYPEVSALNFNGIITNGNVSNPDNTTIDVSKLEVFTPQSSVKLTGNFEGIQKMKYDLNTSVQVSLPEFAKYIPDTLAQNLQGEISAEMQTSGILPDSITDAFIDEVLNKSAFKVKCNNISGIFTDSLTLDNLNADIKYKAGLSGSKNIKIDNLAVKSSGLNVDLVNSSAEMDITGQLADFSGLKIDVKSLRVQQGLNLFSGAATISNPENPEFSMNASIAVKLDELMPFVPDSLIHSMTGNVNMFMRSQGKIDFDKVEDELMPILFNNSRFEVACNDVSVSFPDSIMNFDKLSVDLSYEKDLLTIPKIAAEYNGLPVEADSTIVKNMYKTLLLNQPERLFVNTHINIGDIDFKDFEYLLALNSSVADSAKIEPEEEQLADDEPQNWNFLIHGSAAVKSFSIDSTEFEGYRVNRLHLQDISTLFKLTDTAYIADQFKFKAFGGEANNSVHYKKRKSGLETISSHHVLKDIDIRMMLKDLDNLGQDSLITWQNITGKLSTDLDMTCHVEDPFPIDKLIISGDIVLAEGGVYDYAPAQEMSTLPGLKDLDNLQFKTLRSNIFMHKGRIWVPRTNIVSNALDIAAFGMFDMNYDYDYHLEVHLSDIIFGKSKKRNRKQNAKGDEIDQETLKKSSRKIRYADVDGEKKMGLDTKNSREEMMNKIRTQRRLLDFIFFPKNIHYNTDLPENI